MTADLERLLEKTSRTFALSIPVLPEPTRGEVTIAYLLFRIADTFEDASHWPCEKRRLALADFERLLERPDAEEAARLAPSWVADGISTHAGYTWLMSESPGVLDAYAALTPAARAVVKEHVVRSSRGMAGFVARTSDDGRLALETLDDLHAYFARRRP